MCDHGQQGGKGTSAPPPHICHGGDSGSSAVCMNLVLTQITSVRKYIVTVLSKVCDVAAELNHRDPGTDLVHQRASDAIKKALIVYREVTGTTRVVR